MSLSIVMEENEPRFSEYLVVLETNTKDSESVYACCIDISSRSKSQQFLALSTGIIVLYIIYGYFLELTFRVDGIRPHGLFITFVQFLFYIAYGFCGRLLFQQNVASGVPSSTYMALGLFTVASMSLSNMSLSYLNFPTQVIFKSCKLVPVFFGEIFIQGKKHSFIEFIAACLMSIGLILFVLADNQVMPNFDYRGYIMISAALIADAFISNIQESMIRFYTVSNIEMIYFSYSFGAMYIFIFIMISGDLVNGIFFFMKNPLQNFGFVFIFSTVGYFGMNFVLSMMSIHGALVTVTVTTFRKAATILLSFFLFTKPYTIHYLWGALLVFASIYLNLLRKKVTNKN